MKKTILFFVVASVNYLMLGHVLASDDHRHRGDGDRHGGTVQHEQKSLTPHMKNDSGGSKSHQSTAPPAKSPAKQTNHQDHHAVVEDHRDRCRQGRGGTYWSFDIGPVHIYHGPRPYYYYYFGSDYYLSYYGSSYFYDYSCADPCPYHRYYHYGRCEYGVDDYGSMILLHFYP